MDEAIQSRSRETTVAPVVQAAGGTVLRDVSYGSEAAQRLDVYAPANATKAPVLFIVHGGAWMYGDKANDGFVSNKVEHWVPRGYVVVSTNYRLQPPHPLQQADDVARALAFAQGQAESWGGDPDRFVLVGHSSGAHLVSLLHADPSVAMQHEAKPWLGAVVLDSAAFDVTRIMTKPHLPFYDRVFADDRSLWQQCSPLHRLKTAPSPLLAVCSSERRQSCMQARAYVEKCNALGGKATVHPVDMTHRELNERLGTAGPYTQTVDSFLQSLGLP